MRRVIAGLLLCGIVVAGGTAGRATEQAPAADAGRTAPKGVVARVSAIDGGSLSITQGDSKQAVAGAVNAPVFAGDFLATTAGTTAELQFDGFTMLRLGAGVQARLVADDADARSVQLADGTVELAIAREQDGTSSIDTPSVSIVATQPGDYRVSVAADGSTTATARAGAAQLVTPGKTYELVPGKTFVASGAAANPAISSHDEVAFDAFDDFNGSRDKISAQAIRDGANVPHGIAGYDDLSAYGTWQSLPPYGWVWSPNNVPAGWAPYRDGQWTWSTGYGWTWVSNEPWGWVPYHYGRWFFDSTYGWCWYPPAITVAPAWQPALVSFFGWGSASWGFSTGWANFGWVPLAPYETYYPWYSYGYANPPHATPAPSARPTREPVAPVKPKPPVHGVRPIVEFRNAAAGGATFVSAQAFHDGDFSHAAVVDVRSVTGVTPMHGAPPMKPGPQNLTFSRTDGHSPASVWDRFDGSRGTVRAPVTTITHENYGPATATHANPVSPHANAGPAHAASTPAPKTSTHDPDHDPEHTSKPPA